MSRLIICYRVRPKENKREQWHLIVGSSRFCNREFTQFFQPGWVEHDPYDILQSQIGALFDLIKKFSIKGDDIAAIGITNQLETVVVWDKLTGKPVYNAIVWQCRRTADICEQIKNDGYTDLIKAKTGLVIDAYFSGQR